MRFYGFCHYYLSSIQQAIQAKHCGDDMFVKYRLPDSFNLASDRLWDWAANHKTLILLNGGNCEQLNATYDLFRTIGPELELPYGLFHEDAASLNNALTCVGIVVPEKIYAAAEQLRSPSSLFVPSYDFLSPAERELAMLLSAHGLAR